MSKQSTSLTFKLCDYGNGNEQRKTCLLHLRQDLYWMGEQPLSSERRRSVLRRVQHVESIASTNKIDEVNSTTMANINDNEKSARTQCNMIANYLERGFSITSLEALQMFGCMRLASRICDLRERGYEINTCKIKTETGKWVTEYSLKR